MSAGAPTENVPTTVRPALGPLPPGAYARAPGSKSLTQRALILAALARGPSRLFGGLWAADDPRHLRAALAELGAHFRPLAGDGLEVRPLASEENPGSEGASHRTPITVQVGNGGTTLRFLLPVAAALGWPVRFEGSPRMDQRPLGDLVTALRQLGATIEHGPSPGTPVSILAGMGSQPASSAAIPGLPGIPGGEVTLPGNVSSQFLSGLLLAAPLMPQGLTARVRGPVVSQPYIDLTTTALAHFGVMISAPEGGARPIPPDRRTPRADQSSTDGAMVREREASAWQVPAGQSLTGCEWTLPGDYSSASYLLALPALRGGSLTVAGLDPTDRQGDRAILEILTAMGCTVRWGKRGVTVTHPGSPLKPLRVDATAIPDLVPTLAVLATAAPGCSVITGAGHLRHKECDRLAVLTRGLNALGADITATGESVTVDGSREFLRGSEAPLDPADDHRMAMALALAGMRSRRGAVIANPACVRKSFPLFWQVFQSLR